MANPAAVLLAQFKIWESAPAQTGNGNQKIKHAQRRKVAEDDGVSDHIRAMVALHEVEFHLDRLEKVTPVDSYRKMVSIWARIILAYPHGWQADHPNRHTFTEHAMDSLEHLAVLLDTNLPRLRDLDTSDLLPVFTSIEERLAGDENLPDDVRAYVFNLVEEARRAVSEFEVTGSVDLAVCLRRLKMALFAAADQTKGENKRWYRKMASDVAVPIAVNVAGYLATVPIAGLLGQ